MKLYWRFKKKGKWTWQRATPLPGGNTLGYGTIDCFHFVYNSGEEE